MMRILKFLGLALVLLLAALFINTWRQGSQQVSVPAVTPVKVDIAAASQRLAAGVRLKTISSFDDPALNSDQFIKLHELLRASFPKLHATLKREVLDAAEGGLSVIYTWQGSDPKAKPIAWMAHQDVVPISPGTESAWKADPFGGEIKDGFVWGRGAWDNKGNFFAQMEAVEMLIASGFQPKQTIYLIQGADEEVNGLRGAKKIAGLLAARGVKFDYILDEGLLITEGVLPGLKQPAALVGLAEKGYGTFQLSLEAAPGHSSQPPKQSAIGAMSVALTRLEEQQYPTQISGVPAQMFSALAPEMSGVNRLLLSNLWLFGPVVRGQLEKSPASAAMLHTTTALTIFQAGNKDNVLPGHVDATVNFRLLPGDTLKDVETHVKSAVANDKIAVKAYGGNSEASPVSPTNNAGYAAIQRTLRELFPETTVAPGLMIGATDARYMTAVTDATYRFSPIRAKPEDLPRFHGTNERLSLVNYAEAIQFYHQLLRNSGAKAP